MPATITPAVSGPSRCRANACTAGSSQYATPCSATATTDRPSTRARIGGAGGVALRADGYRFGHACHRIPPHRRPVRADPGRAARPGAGEVRVRVHRSGVNPTDWKSRRGTGSVGVGGPIHPPQVPGQDGAGVVDAVGVGVDAALVGQRVWIWEAAYRRADGTTQEFAVVPASHVVRLPPEASFDLGAALGIPFMTAHRCLT